MPPGYAPTQGEVDDLIEKFAKVKLSGMSIMTFPQQPREAELLSMPDVFKDVESALTTITSISPLGNQPSPQTGKTVQTTFQTPMNHWNAPSQASQTYNNQTYNGGPRGPMVCYACGKEGHPAALCPDKDALVRNRWAHIGPDRRLYWGTAERPQDEVRTRRGQPIVQSMVEGIKGQLQRNGHPVVDPLTTMNPHEPAAQSPIGVASNTIVMNDPSEAAGIVSPEAFAQALREADLDASFLEGIFQVSSVGYTNPNRSACETVQNAALKGPSSRAPVVRNNKNRDSDWHLPKAVSFDEDIDITDQPAGDKAPRDAPKKLRLLDSLTANPDAMVTQVLRTPVSVSLNDLLALAPEIQKRFGKPFYQAGELPVVADNDPDNKSKRHINLQLNNLTVSCPEYFHVRATNGMITQVGTRSACLNRQLEHLPALPRPNSHQSFSITAHDGDNADDDRTTSEQREYDREHGFEHVRRDCPRAPTTINGARLSALLDSGAELNTIRLKTAQAAGLVITSMPMEMATSRMQAANGSFETFAGMVWRAPVAIGNIVIPTNLFVLRSLSSPIILGNPYLADAQCTFQYKADGKMRCTIYSEDRSSNATFIGATDNTLGTIARASIQPKDIGAKS